MDGLQGEELAGQLSAECWLQHELWVLTDAEQLRSQAILSISKHPQLMLQPTLSTELPCEFLSLETIHRWILRTSVT